MLVRDDIGPSPGGDDRDLQQFRELQQLGRRAGAQDAATGEDDRALGRGEQLDDRTQVLVGGCRRAGSPSVHPRIVGRRLIEQVFRERQQDWPGPPAERLNVHVSDLNLALGDIDPTTGRPVAKPGDPNNLFATTFGRGTFTIRLAPIVFPNTASQPSNISLAPVSGAGTNPAGIPLVNPTTSRPIINGFSEQTAFGNRRADYSLRPDRPH